MAGTGGAGRTRKASGGAPAPAPKPAVPEDPRLSDFNYCREHRDFFRTNCLKIATKARGLQPFEPNTTQRVLYATVDRLRAKGIPPRVIVLKSRQVGISTASEAEIFGEVFFNPHRTGLVLAHNKPAAKGLFRMTQRFYRNLPTGLRIGTNLANVHEIELENGSRMQVEAVGDVRSYTAQYAHLCFPPDTPILCEDGIERRADAVRVGDVVLTHNGNRTRISGISSRLNLDDVVVVHPWLGRPITLTANHPVFTMRGWVPAGDLTPTDYVSMPVRGFTGPPPPKIVLTKAKITTSGRERARAGSGMEVPLDHETGYFFGYYLAEGHVSSNPGGRASSITMARDCDEGRYADRAWNAVERFCSSRNQRRSKDSRTVSDVFYGAALAEATREHFGHLQTKRVPDWVFAAGPEFCRGLLLGYLSGDGSKGMAKYDAVTATSIRSSIAYQMRDIAASLGFGWAAVGFRPAGVYHGRNSQAAWTVRWSGMAARSIRELMGLPTTGRAKPQAEKAELLDGHAWMKIRSLSTQPCPEVYDIEVEHPDHSFRTASFSIKNSEFAFWENATEVFLALMQSVPFDINSLAIIESTANGVGNKFHQMWLNAIASHEDPDAQPWERGWTPIFIPWFKHEEYRMKPWFRREDLRGEEVKLARAHALDMTHIAWRRWCIKTNCDGDVSLFQVEYPSTWQEAFALSGRPVFDSEGMAHYQSMVPSIVAGHAAPPIADGPEYVYHSAKPCEIAWDTEKREPVLDYVEGGRLRIFKPYNPRHTYILGVDPSEGDVKSDPSPIEVLDQMTLEFVAEWWGRTPPDVLADFSAWLGRYYGNALIIGEANNHGISFHGRLLALEYPNLYFRATNEETIAGEITLKPGYWETNKAKHLLIDTFRKYVRERRGGIYSPGLVGEMGTTIYDRREEMAKTRIKPQPGNFIDRVMAAGMALLAHRGDEKSPLLPLPDIDLIVADERIRLMRERNPDAAAQLALDLTGMTEGELSSILVAREGDRRLQAELGTGGLR